MNILGIMSGNSCDGLDCCDVDININSDYQLKYKINEIPIIFKDREIGESKMSFKIFGEAFYGIALMKLKSFFVKYRR